MDLYAVLELEPTASQEDIRKAYRKLALLYHPDKNLGFQSKQFTDIKTAHDILSDPMQRKIYDEEKHTSKSIVDWKQFIGDVMTSMYVIFATYVVPKDIELSINVNFDDVYNRRVKKLEVKVKRWINSSHYGNATQCIYIPLNSLKQDSIFHFEGLGDDSIMVSKPRSSVKIKVSILGFEKGVHIQDILNDFDLYVLKDISLYEFYTIDTFEIKICDGVFLHIPNTQQYNYNVKNAGLPFGDGLRGDVFIKISIKLPPSIPLSIHDVIKTHFHKDTYFGI